MEDIFITYANSSLAEDPHNFYKILEEVYRCIPDLIGSEWAFPIPYSEDTSIIKHPDAHTILSEVIAEILYLTREPSPAHAGRSLHTPYGHPVPGKVRRSCKIGVDFVLRETQVPEYAVQNGLMRPADQRHIDSVYRHPVDFLFPALPIPERRGITVRHCIEIIVIFVWACDFIVVSG